MASDPWSSLFFGGFTAAQDGWIEVELQPGETISAVLTGESGAALSLLARCGDVSSSVAHAHERFESSAAIRFRNPEREPTTYYLLLDAMVASGPFTLDVDIGL